MPHHRAGAVLFGVVVVEHYVIHHAFPHALLDVFRAVRIAGDQIYLVMADVQVFEVA
ncbi:hypothetical protein SDC9_149991 [bioreactor metagenome]|uniref:Uncharacterized protein n=1 Tax=bioreactor metagenome TaxID=1076179 RepID=A0A645EL56_9ZZZZ